jgi:hypothetical protein
MRDLAFHYESVRRSYPDDELLIVFDIDGTILDMRYLILEVLHGYDRKNGTDFFRFLNADDIHFHENEIEDFLKESGISEPARSEIIEWYVLNFWSPEIIMRSHRPFEGVLDVIRWFQLQPRTSVGLNTGRSEHMRADTLHVLNTLGSEYRVNFPSSLLFMDRGSDTAGSKIKGLRTFSDMGYHVVAMIDNEPANLKAVAESGMADGILLLHADTIFESAPAHIPAKTVSGMYYDITDLIPEKGLPKHIGFVWHGVDDESIMRQFLKSNVHWAEMHVHLNPSDSSVIVRRKSFQGIPRMPGEAPLKLDYFLSLIKHAGKGAKLDIKEEGIIDKVIGCLKEVGLSDGQVWINKNTNSMNMHWIKSASHAFPSAVKQCPVDSMAWQITSSPTEAKRILAMYAAWGINRFSVNWKTPGSRRLIIHLQNWGYEVNIYNVPDLESFLQAALLLPRSITSYFNFPKWFYQGKNREEGYRAGVLMDIRS